MAGKRWIVHAGLGSDESCKVLVRLDVQTYVIARITCIGQVHLCGFNRIGNRNRLSFLGRPLVLAKFLTC